MDPVEEKTFRVWFKTGSITGFPWLKNLLSSKYQDSENCLLFDEGEENELDCQGLILGSWVLNSPFEDSIPNKNHAFPAKSLRCGKHAEGEFIRTGSQARKLAGESRG